MTYKYHDEMPEEIDLLDEAIKNLSNESDIFGFDMLISHEHVQVMVLFDHHKTDPKTNKVVREYTNWSILFNDGMITVRKKNSGNDGGIDWAEMKYDRPYKISEKIIQAIEQHVQEVLPHVFYALTSRWDVIRKNAWLLENEGRMNLEPVPNG